jgi:hypothetical protein
MPTVRASDLEPGDVMIAMANRRGHLEPFPVGEITVRMITFGQREGRRQVYIHPETLARMTVQPDREVEIHERS